MEEATPLQLSPPLLCITPCVCHPSPFLCQVDAAAVRQQRLGGGDGSCPVSLEMLAEYEEFVRTFK